MKPVMDAITLVPVALVVQPRASVTYKSPLTNRIRRQFARIKAVRTDCGRSWLVQRIEVQMLQRARKTPGECCGRLADGKSEHVEDVSQDTSKTTVRTRRRRRSGHVEDDGQDTSKTTVRTRRDRRPGRSCRPPFHCRPRREPANDARFRPQSPAKRCDRPSAPSAPRG